MPPDNSDRIDGTPSGDSWTDQVVDYESALANGSPPRSIPDKGLADEDQQRVAYGCLAADALREVFQSTKGSDDPPPQTLGDFRLLREIGRGGMGVVYEAEQISLGRRFALKVLPFASMLDKQQLNRFKNEARAAASLEHPNIVAVHSVGVERGTHFYAMQMVDGQSLAEVIAARKKIAKVGTAENNATVTRLSNSAIRNPQSAADTRPVAELSTIVYSGASGHYRVAARLGLQAAEALHYAHENGIVHRDIKPGNLLVDPEGKLYVTDFGLARIEAEQSLTQAGDVLGTLRYMSPEQALAKHSMVDQRTDIYSLGATLYELIAVRPPFEANNRQELLKQIDVEDPIPLRFLEPRLPVDLQTIVLKAMAKDPADRYFSAKQLSEDLQAYLDNRPIQAKPPTITERMAKWSRRHAALVRAAAAVLACLMLMLTITVVSLSEAARTSQAAEKRAINAAALATREKEEALSNLYRANVQIAYQEWQDGRVDRSLALLPEIVPRQGDKDLRCWEWYFVKGLCLDGYITDGAMVECRANCPSRLIDRQKGDSISFFDFESGEIRLTLATQGNQDSEHVLAPDGQQIASAFGLPGVAPYLGDAETTVSIFHVIDLQTRRPVWKKRVSPVVLEMDWSPSGDQIATAHRGGAVRIWEAKTGALVKEMKGGAGVSWVENVRWCPSGKWVAAGRRIWDAGSGQPAFVQLTETEKYQQSAGGGLDWMTGGTRIVVSHDEGVSLWDLESGQRLQHILAHRGPVSQVTAAPEINAFATCGADNFVRLWSAEDGQLLNEFRHVGRVATIAWLPGGKKLVATSYGAEGNRVCVWSRNANQSGIVLPGRSAMTWTPSGELVVCRKHDDAWSYDVVEPQTGERKRSIIDERRSAHINYLAVDTSGTLLASSNSNGNLRLWNLGSGELIRNIKANEMETLDVAWSPDGTMLATTGDKGFKVWDATSGRSISQLVIDDRRLPLDGFSVSWCPDGRLLAGLKHRDIRLWDTASWNEIVTVHSSDAGDRSANLLCWSPNGDCFASCTGQAVDIWDARSGRNLLHIRAHNTDAHAIAWSPDGQRIATGGDGRLIRIWNAQTGEDMLSLRGHDDAVQYLAWSPDGRRLASCDGGSVRIWDASNGYKHSD